MRRTCLVLFGVLGAASIASADLPSTQLTSIFPMGGKFGSSIDVKCNGGEMDEATRLVFSHPGIEATAKMGSGNEFEPAKPTAGQFTVSIAGDVPPGTYEARVVGRYGISNPRSFRVGIHDEAIDGDGNATREQAQQIEVDRTINGVVAANAREFFQVSLQGGQRILIECMAQQIDSRLDGVLVIHDSNGRELARCNDYQGRDPFVDFIAPEDGQYQIAIYDFLYRGGNDYFYRLTVHVGPHIDFVFPPSGVPGSQQEYTIFGRNLPGGTPAELQIDGVAIEKLQVVIPAPARDQVSTVDYEPAHAAPIDQFTHGLGFAQVPIYFADGPVVAEVEPNGEASEVQKVTAPCEVVGQFFPSGDVDYVEFDAKKGEIFYLDLLAHRLGKPMDPRILVQKVTRNDKGEETVSDIANIDDPGDRNGRIGSDFDLSTDDPTYRLTADADATYRVIMLDQAGDAGSDLRMVYRFAIRKPVPDFRLFAVPIVVATPDDGNAVRTGTANLRQGGTTLLQVRAVRQDGFDGEIRIAVEGLPEGVSCREAPILVGGDNVQLVLEADENAEVWAGTIRVLGLAKLNGQEVTREARGGVTVWGTGNRQQDQPAFRASQDIMLSVMPEMAPADVDLAEAVVETSRGAKLEIPIKVNRRRGFAGELKLVCLGLPKELKPGDITVKGDAGEAKLELAVTNKAAKPGVYRFFLRADTKAKLVRDPNAVADAEGRQQKLDETIKELEASLAKAKQQQEDAAKSESKDLAELQKQVDTLAARLKLAQESKTRADKHLEDVKKANEPKDMTFVAISSPVVLHVGNSPLKLAFTVKELALQRGKATKLSMKLERLHGFADKVQVAIELPKDVKGITVAPYEFAADGTDAELELTAADDATAGSHTVSVRAKAKFNEIDVETTTTLVLNVGE